MKIDTTKTVDQAADIYTKKFDNSCAWLHALTLNNLVFTSRFWQSVSRQQYHTAIHALPPFSKAGGA
eukprot:12494628-Prorocentrum_lima.AAC.1